MPRKIVQMVATTACTQTTNILVVVDDTGQAWRLPLNVLGSAPYPAQWLPLPSLPEREG